MNRFNIGILSPKLYPCSTGGLELFNYYFIDYLSEFYNLTIFSECYYYKDNISIKKINSFPLIKSLTININIFLSLLKNRNLDLLIFPYTSNSPLIYSVLLLQVITKLKYIIIIHGGGMYPWRQKYFQKKFFSEAADIIAVSKPIKNEYELRTDREIKIISPIIPFKSAMESKAHLKSKHGFNTGDIIISCVGSLKDIKGSDILLDAYIKLGSKFIKNNSIKLVYVGDGNLKTELEEEVYKNNLNDYVIFMGRFPHENVNEIYKITDIYVIPSLFEGTPLALLEAMFNSITILGSDVTGINNIIKNGENGLLFNLSDSNDLKNKLKELIEHKENYKHLGLNAKSTYDSNFNYESTISLYKNIFESFMVEDV